MPTPIAHSIVGLSIALVSKYGKVFNNNYLNVLLIVFVSVAPDLDFIPGLFVGTMSKYHHGITHSFFIAILFGFLFSLLMYIFQKRHFLSRAFLFSAIYSFHIILDLFGYDDGKINGIGMPIFFPLNSDRYISSISLFYGELLENGNLTFHSLFRFPNLFLVIVEVFVSLLVVIILITAVNVLKNKKIINTKRYE